MSRDYRVFVQKFILFYLINRAVQRSINHAFTNFRLVSRNTGVLGEKLMSRDYHVFVQKFIFFSSN